MSLSFMRDNSDPYISHQLAQTHYLLGNWSKSIEIRRAELAAWDNRAAQFGLDKLGSRFIAGSFLGHIGHHGFIDALIKARELGLLSPERRTIVGREDSFANRSFVTYLSRYFDLHLMTATDFRQFEATMKPLFEDVSLVRMKRGLTEIYSAYSEINEKWKAEGRAPLFQLEPKHEERGRAVLRKWGVSDDDWFVSLHVREGDGNPWTNNADARIESYQRAIDRIVNSGGWVIRMGNPSMTPLKVQDQVVDYSRSSDRSDWMDVFLWSRCRAFVGSMSGPFNIPAVFGVPTLITNHGGFGLDQGFNRSLMLPKLYWDISTRRMLSAKEMLDGPFGWTVSRRFPGHEIEIVENSPEELEQGVVSILEIANRAECFDEMKLEQKSLLESLARHSRMGRTPFPAHFIGSHVEVFAD